VSNPLNSLSCTLTSNAVGSSTATPCSIHARRDRIEWKRLHFLWIIREGRNCALCNWLIFMTLWTYHAVGWDLARRGRGWPCPPRVAGSAGFRRGFGHREPLGAWRGVAHGHGMSLPLLARGRQASRQYLILLMYIYLVSALASMYSGSQKSWPLLP